MRRIAAAAVALLVLPAAAMASGMPQLDFANPLTISQVEWGAGIFVLLYFLLSRLGLPQVARVLEERGTRIAGDLETAHAAKARADGAVSEMTETTAKARAEAQAAINAALDKAKAEAAQQAAVLNEKLETQLKQAEASIATARNTAMAALREVATETATTVISRLTGAAPDRVRLDSAIRTAIAARPAG
jgi:F-type H+-transporting ATPase subunit b